MSSKWPIPRPTENAALREYDRPFPSIPRVTDALIAARATGDRYGARYFSHMLDRALDLVPETQ
ncbi:hypothetical protein [Streptomyces clavifer]|uniref:hypothetical protein n=1 Tax=Streptomyces clavifer TaxID=68188 RepID=UPI00380E33E7